MKCHLCGKESAIQLIKKYQPRGLVCPFFMNICQTCNRREQQIFFNLLDSTFYFSDELPEKSLTIESLIDFFWRER